MHNHAEKTKLRVTEPKIPLNIGKQENHHCVDPVGRRMAETDQIDRSLAFDLKSGRRVGSAHESDMVRVGALTSRFFQIRILGSETTNLPLLPAPHPRFGRIRLEIGIRLSTDAGQYLNDRRGRSTALKPLTTNFPASTPVARYHGVRSRGCDQLFFLIRRATNLRSPP